jgi:hypothetical protein
MTLPEFACTCVPDSPPCLGCRANAVIAAAYAAGVREERERVAASADARKTPADRVAELQRWYAEQTGSHLWHDLRAEILRHITEAEAAARERTE